MDTQKPTIKLSNKVTIYDQLDDFKGNFESDYYKHSSEVDFYNYLQLLKILYKKFVENQKPIKVRLGINVDAKEKSSGQIFKIDSDNVNVTVIPVDPIYKMIFQQSEILKFIEIEIAKENEKLKFPKIGFTRPLDVSEIPELDFSDTLPLERMILLEKLGVIKYIQSLQSDPLNQSHTALILSSICGIPQGTIKKNIGVMLGTNKNDDDKNSPYKNTKNSELANRKFQKFVIDESKILK